MFSLRVASFLFLALSSTATSAPSSSSHPQAKLGSGIAIGRTSNGVESWKSIPYASKPIGNLRLMPPELPPELNQTVHFDKQPNACFNLNSTVPIPNLLSEEQKAKLENLTAEAYASERRNGGSSDYLTRSSSFPLHLPLSVLPSRRSRRKREQQFYCNSKRGESSDLSPPSYLSSDGQSPTHCRIVFTSTSFALREPKLMRSFRWSFGSMEGDFSLETSPPIDRRPSFEEARSCLKMSCTFK